MVVGDGTVIESAADEVAIGELADELVIAADEEVEVAADVVAADVVPTEFDPELHPAISTNEVPTAAAVAHPRRIATMRLPT